MANIYDLHAKAFSNTAAYVICANGERVMTIAIKYPKDGAGRLWAYVYFIGQPMVRSYANGYGYDKTSAAVSSAIESIPLPVVPDELAGKAWAELSCARDREAIAELQNGFKNIGGKGWSDIFRDLGYQTYQAV